MSGGPWPPEMKPFSPEDAKNAKLNAMPPEIIQAVNELLAEGYKDHGYIIIKLKEIKARCRRILGVDGELFSGIDPMDSWPSGVWDFEPIYRKAGWKVSYDGPGYNESYDGFYQFDRKRSNDD